ncbi:pentatricopeptide repeat-containing protein At3g58590 [Impatiens glandulifera]|uniref:pentatricopeptide repeat-containing protein At3g58590 n=1 Tax=Impatiens glandulifera TaxID=253017 RepID=UPI001FB11F70|nr:pentatricopeptide repeat-containing protein At3g58590 [Impatiens glandulifera]
MPPPLMSASNSARSFLISFRSFHSQCSSSTPPQHWFSLLKQCNARSLQTIQTIHAFAITIGWWGLYSEAIILRNNIMSGYIAAGKLGYARELFDEMQERNAASYNIIIGGYSRKSDEMEAWELFYEMRMNRFWPTQYTFSGILACKSLDINKGCILHGLILKTGMLQINAFVGTALMNMYGMHGFVEEAFDLFVDMPNKNLVTWNTMISLFGRNGFPQQSFFMFRDLLRMEEEEERISEPSYIGVLSSCSHPDNLEEGHQIHGLVMKNGFLDTVTLANSLINMYAKCSGLQIAEKIFNEIKPYSNVVSWNTILGLMAKTDQTENGVNFFLEMLRNGVRPNQATFVSAVNLFTSLCAPIYGEFVHAKIIKQISETDLHVGSVLVDFYAKHGLLEESRRCFDEICEKNVVSWNGLINGYSNRCWLTSISLLKEMILSGPPPNEVSFSTLLKSFLPLTLLEQIHSSIVKNGYEQNEYVLSSLITSYAENNIIYNDAFHAQESVFVYNAIAAVYNRTGQYHKTQELFTRLMEPDLLSWNILIEACCRNNDLYEVFDLFKQMRKSGQHPDNCTYISLLTACTKLCNLALGSSLHGFIVKNDFKLCDTFVCNVMIDMYGKCGSPSSSLKIFEETVEKNVITWTALISALGLHGKGEEALEKFREMEAVGELKPDGVTFMAVLSACRHAGLVCEGMEVFSTMEIEPDIGHYVVMVGMLTICGRFKEAERLICKMPFPPNALIWRSFLEGCRRWHAVSSFI